MGLRITDGMYTDSLQQQIQTLQQEQYKYNQQVTTGQKVINPSDDPSAASRIIQAQTSKDQLSQLYKNENRAENIANVTSSYLQNQITNINDPIQELAIKASGTDTSQFDTSATQVDSLLNQAISNVNQKYLGEYLFSGLKTGTEPFSVTKDTDGKIIDVQYNGTPSGGDQQTFSVADGMTVSPYASGDVNQNVILPQLKHLIALRDHLAAHDSTSVQSDIQTLKADGDNLVKATSITNSTLTRLEMAKTQNSTNYLNREKQISADADSNIADAMTQYQKSQYALTAAMQTGSMIMQQSILNYL